MSNFTKILLPVLTRSAQLIRLSASQQQRYFYSNRIAAPSVPLLLHNIQQRFISTKMTKADIERRVMTVVSAFDKITADKLKLDSHFINDLGLDSLDHVEVIMAMEDEFGFEIPDQDAERLFKPAELIIKHAPRSL